jgi:hypothetical protein
MKLIAAVESKDLDPPPSGGKTTPDRKWILETYAECLRAIRGTGSFSDMKRHRP